MVVSGAGLLLSMALAGSCQADPAPPAVAGLVVTAIRPDAQSDIDKRVYTVTADPQVETSTGQDILGKVPSVSVSPAGKVSLLGSGSVTILIDGRKPTNAEAALRNLPASRIARIEVITNPGAQYPAAGTGGIINIVTRRPAGQALAGSLRVSGDSQGAAQIALAPTFGVGRWSFEGNLGASRDRSRSDSWTLRAITDPGTGDVSRSDFASRWRSRQDGDSASLRTTFKPDERDTFSLSLSGSRRRGDSRESTVATGLTGSFDDYVESSTGANRLQSARAGLDFERRGDREGETLKLAASVDHLDWRLRDEIGQDFASSALTDSRYRTQTRWDVQSNEATLDYERPFGAQMRFSGGLSWTQEIERFDRARTVLAGVGPGSALRRQVTGDRGILAAYATLQFPLGPWTVKPGLRLEDESFESRAAGVATPSRDPALFPSLFVQRSLGEALQVNVSYSKRTDRPGVQALDPYVDYADSTTASTGNPALRPETTDSYEARLEYNRPRFNLVLTFYDRETRDVWASSTRLLPGGVRLTSQINAGTRANRGAETSVRGSFGRRWKYAATVDLFSQTQDIYAPGGARSESAFTYSGNAQLDYDAPAPEGRKGDQWQLSLRYSGPQREYQFETEAYYRLDLTWRHPLTDRATAVLTVVDLMDSASPGYRSVAPSVTIDSRYRSDGRRLKLTLVYRFGKSPSG